MKYYLEKFFFGFLGKIKKINYFIYFSAFVLSLILAVESFVFLNSVKYFQTVSQKTNEIKNLNSKIDEIFNSNFSSLNYDDLNSKNAKINKALFDLFEFSNKNFFIKTKENENNLKNLRVGILQKKELLKKYKILKSKESNLLALIKKDLKFFPNTQNLSPFLLDFRGKYFENNFDKDKFDSKINSVILNSKDENEIKIYKEFLDLANVSYEISKIKESALNNEIDNITDRILYNLNSKINSELNEIYYLVYGLILVLTLFIFKIYFSNKNNKISENENKISKNLIRNSINAVIKISKNGNIVFYNNAFKNMCPLWKLNSNLIPCISKQSSGKYEEFNLVQRALKCRSTKKSRKVIIKDLSKDLIFANLICIPFFDIYGKFDGVFVLFEDMSTFMKMDSKLRIANTRNRDLSKKDYLTLAYNQSALLHKIKANKRAKKQIIYFFVKYFENLYYIYPHTVIEQIVVEIAKSVELFLDIYKSKSDLFRIQNGEFVIYFEDLNLHDFIDELFKFLSSKKLIITNIDGEIYFPNIDISFGVSLKYDVKELDRYSQAMLSAKKAAREGKMIEYYSKEQNIGLSHKKNQEILKLLRYAISNPKKIIVELQGIFLRDGEGFKVHHYEMLIRIIDEFGRIHYPNEFLSVAKNSSLYIPLTKRVIELAFELVDKYENTCFALNLSSIDMHDEGVKKDFIQRLKECKNPSNVMIEVLESDSVQDYRNLNEFIKKIRSYGVKIAIDDFGSGYSNYYRLLELEFDYIKIDGAIIRKVPNDKNAKIIVETIIEFAKKENISLVAEYIANEEILNAINEFKTDGKFDIELLQGFYIAKPTNPLNINF